MICYLLLVSRCQTSCGNFQGHDHQNEGAVLHRRGWVIYKSSIKKKKRNSNQAEKDARLFDSAAIAQEADDEDKSSSRNQQIGALSDNLWLYQVLLGEKQTHLSHCRWCRSRSCFSHTCTFSAWVTLIRVRKEFWSAANQIPTPKTAAPAHCNKKKKFTIRVTSSSKKQYSQKGQSWRDTARISPRWLRNRAALWILSMNQNAGAKMAATDSKGFRNCTKYANA